MPVYCDALFLDDELMMKYTLSDLNEVVSVLKQESCIFCFLFIFAYVDDEDALIH